MLKKIYTEFFLEKGQIIFKNKNKNIFPNILLLTSQEYVLKGKKSNSKWV